MKFGVFAGGYFADRISEMARRHGAKVVRAEKPWGETFDADELCDFVQCERPKLVAFVDTETSTGTGQAAE